MTHTRETRGQHAHRSIPTRVDQRLITSLKRAGFFGAMVDVASHRFQKSLSRPHLMLRNGWLLKADPQNLSVRAYALEGAKNRPGGLGQLLVIDKERRLAKLSTYGPGQYQEIQVELGTFRVVHNRNRLTA